MAKNNDLLESIKNSLNSVDRSFEKSELIDKEHNNVKNKEIIFYSKKIIKSISIDEKTQKMLDELKQKNYKINLSQLVRREVYKIYEELINEIN